MKLLLTSNGFTDTIAKTFLSLLTKPVEKNSVVFITTAAFGEDWDPTWNSPEWLEEYRNQLRNLGVTNIEDIDLRNETEESLKNKLLNKDIVFVNGGNTFFLLHYVRTSGFGNVLKHFFEQGGVYVGVSAGSIIACPTIETASFEPADKNLVEFHDITALNLVSFLIHPHYEDSQSEQIKTDAKKTSLPIVALTNEQAIHVQDDTYTFVGEGQKNFFNGFEAN